MVAKGFKGRYFSLQAITATVSAIKLEKAEHTILHLFIPQKIQKEEAPPDERPKPCFCNIFFACLAHKALKLARIKQPPLCRCRKTKTGIAPPSTPK